MSPKAKYSQIGPLLLLSGLFWALAADRGVLSFRHALPYGLTTAASGLVIVGLHTFRSGKRRLLSLATFGAGAAFFVTYLGGLWGNYQWVAKADQVRAMLPGYRDEILLQILIVATILVASCLLGLFGMNFRFRGGAGAPKAPRKKRRPRTAPIRQSNFVRSLRR